MITFLFLFFWNAKAVDVWLTPARFMTPQEEKMLVKEYRERFKDRLILSAFEVQLGRPHHDDQLKKILQEDDDMHALYLQGSFEELLRSLDQGIERISALPAVGGVESLIFGRLLRKAEVGGLVSKAEGKPADLASWQRAAAWLTRPKDLEKRFSPAVLNKLKVVREALPKHEVTIVAPVTAVVLVDGKKLSFDGEFFRAQVVEGDHQLAVLVPGGQWSVKPISVSKDKTYFQVEIRPLVAGTCETPQYIGPFFSSGRRIIAIFNGGCERVYDGKAWYSLEGQPMEVVSPQVAMSFAEYDPNPRPRFFKKMIRSPWFWTGLGVAVVGGLVYYNNNSETVVTPTHTLH